MHMYLSIFYHFSSVHVKQSQKISVFWYKNMCVCVSSDKRERSSSPWFTLQISVTVRAASGQELHPGLQFRYLEHHHYFSRHIGRELNWKPSRQDLGLHSHLGCQHYPLLNPPHTTTLISVQNKTNFFFKFMPTRGPQKVCAKCTV